MTKKPKKPVDLVAKLDRVFSKWVRLSAAHGGYVKCFTCGKIDVPERMDAGHFVGRKHMCTRWDELNVHPQCMQCNRFLEGEKDSYAYALVCMYGEGIIAHLNERKNAFCHYSTKELEDLIATYQQKIKSRETVKKYI